MIDDTVIPPRTLARWLAWGVLGWLLWLAPLGVYLLVDHLVGR